MPKKLTDEEKQLRKWQKDDALEKVLLCKCGKKHEIIKRLHSYFCKCGRNIIYIYNVNYRNCDVIFTKEKEEIGW